MEQEKTLIFHIMVFSNFGSPLYEGFQNNIVVNNDNGEQEDFKYKFNQLSLWR